MICLHISNAEAHVQAHTNLGLLLAREPLNMVNEAAMHLRAAAHYGDSHADTHFNLAVLLHMRLNEPDQACREYVRALELDVTVADYHAYFASLCEDHFRQHDIAWQHFNEALLIDNKHILARIGLAKIQENLHGDYVLAAQLYAEAIALNSMLMEPRYHLARLHLRANQPYRCLDELTYVLLMDEPCAQLHTHIALCFASEDRGQALQHLVQAEQLDPLSPIVHHNLAALYRTPDHRLRVATSPGDLRRALRHLQIALDMQPDDPDTLWNIAEVLFALQPEDLRPIEKLYARVINLHPTCVRAMHGLALMYLSVGRFGEALELCHVARQTDERRPEPLRTMAKLLYEVFDRPEEALQYAQAAYMLDPTHVETMAMLIVLLAPDSFRSAVNYAQRLYHLYPEHEVAQGLFFFLLTNADVLQQ